MIHVPAVDPEEDQVTGRQRVPGNGPRRAPLSVSGPRNFDTGLLVRVHRKTAAIKSVQVCSTEMIGDANDLRRGLRDEDSAVSRQFI
jgi:hypothetical protein